MIPWWNSCWSRLSSWISLARSLGGGCVTVSPSPQLCDAVSLATSARRFSTVLCREAFSPAQISWTTERSSAEIFFTARDASVLVVPGSSEDPGSCDMAEAVGPVANLLDVEEGGGGGGGALCSFLFALPARMRSGSGTPSTGALPLLLESRAERPRDIRSTVDKFSPPSPVFELDRDGGLFDDGPLSPVMITCLIKTCC